MNADRFLAETLFQPHRERILYPVAVVLPVVFMPFALHHLLFDDKALAVALIAAMAMLAADALALSSGRRPPFPFPLLLVPGVAAVGLALVSHGIHGALWAFPAALFTYFVLARPYANAACVSMAGMGTALVYLHIDGATALRFALALGLCLVIVNLILRVMESLNQRLLEASVTDPLTGLLNRRRMDESMALLAERQRRGGAAASAVLIDVDHFKAVNDRFGHEAGDRVLKGLADVLRRRARKLDQVFRIGGEEFLVLLPDTRAADAAAVAEQLRDAVGRAELLEERRVTISVGVSELRGGDTPDSWLRRVDAALYEAKRAGRDRVERTGAHPGLAAALARPMGAAH